MATPKKSDDDELALQVEIDTGAADHSHETPAKGTSDESNRQGLIKQSLSAKIFDPKSLAKQCLKHIGVTIIAVSLVIALFGVITLIALVKFNRAKCSQAQADRARFVDVSFKVPATLPTKYYPALRELVKAADVTNQIFLRQVWANNEALDKFLREENACAGSVYQYFKLNSGPWSRLDDNVRFVNHTGDVPEVKPAGSNFYPAGMTEESFKAWVEKNPSLKMNATSMYTVIRAGATAGTYNVVPYSSVYSDLLNALSLHLNNAITSLTETQDESVKNYLKALVDDMKTNNYRSSSEAFLKVDEEPVLRVQMGPYGVKEDTLLGLKNSFVSYIAVMDKTGTEELRNISSFMRRVPFKITFDNTTETYLIADNRPIYVQTLLYNGGEARDTLQEIAISLPQDPSVVQALGVKRLLFLNVAEAKFDAVLEPLAEHVISRYQRHYYNKDAFVYYCMGRELARGLGPQEITIWDPFELRMVTRTVKETLGVHYFTMQEVKADAAGLSILVHLANNRMVHFNMSNMGLEDNPEEVVVRRSLYVTWLGYIFNRIRYGSADATQQSARVAFNYLRTKKAIVIEKESVINEETELPETVYRYGINFPAMEFALNSLVSEILTIERTSVNYHEAAHFIEKYEELTVEAEHVIEGIKEAKLPVEIYPHYTLTDTLAASA